MQGSRLKVIFYCFLVGATTVTLPVRGADNVIAPVQPLSTGEQPASSIPSREIELKFSQLGLIADVKVKDGDNVKKGQVLALQDTTVEQAALQREQYDLKSTVQKRAAEKQRDLSEVKWKRREALLNPANGETGGANKEEVEEARLQFEVDKLKVELAQEETEKKRLDIIKLQKQIDRMKIVAPYDGVIRKVENQVGSVSDPQKASIVFVVNDPVKVETKIPTHLAAGLKIGETLQVRYIDEKDYREAKIVYFDPVADAGVVGGMQLIHLEMPNPDGRRAGQEMAVKLPQNVAAAK
jgi:multidrug efflux system membrane fusion protein